MNEDIEPIYANSLTPDDRLFLAYLAAWVKDIGFGGPSLRGMARDLCENYKEQEK